MRQCHFKTKLAAAAFLTLAICCFPVEAVAQNNPIVWPTQKWTHSSPEAQGMDSASLLALLDFGAANDMDSLVITRHGRLVAEAYYAPFKAGMRHKVNSATKGVVGVLTGVAISQGHLKSVDEPVLGFFAGQTEAKPEAGKAAITISHLLNMTSGIGWSEPLSNVVPESLFAMLRDKNWVQFVLNRPMADAPGTRFNYNSGNSQLLSAILTQQTGMPLADYAARHLFAPLGIANVDWRHDPQGINTGGFGLYLTTRDMAKLGYLVLRRGEWDGQQIVRREWVNKVFQASIPMEISAQTDWRYGDGWWTVPARKAYLAVGFNRQLIIVMPDLGIVVATTGRKNYPFEPLFDLISASVKSETPLAPNPLAVLGLAQRQTQLATENQANLPTPVLAKTWSGKTYELAINNLGLKEFTLNLEGNGSYELVIYVARGSNETRKVTLPLGLDGRFAAAQPDKPDPIDQGRDRLTRAAWLNPSTLKIETRRPSEGEAQTFVLEFSESRVVISLSNELGQSMRLTGDSH